MSVQTALFTDRIQAVADFGMKTLHLPLTTAPKDFQGIRDYCHILPGMLSLCDRNVLSLAYCPRKMLAGHGKQDVRSSEEGPSQYKKLYERQYEALGVSENYEYHIHDGGDTMPEEAVIDYFQRVFDE